MVLSLTPEQILALAPDTSSAKAGSALAGVRHWQRLGRNQTSAWGEHQGSAREPYRSCIDLTAPAFHCTCPSRKFPCKHGLGLYLTLAREPAAFPEAGTPDWVVTWLDAREKRAKKTIAPKSETSAPDEKAQAKRLAQREKKIKAGLDELERWLGDLMRRGLALAQMQPYVYWE